jgi:hypothetical protein
VPARLRQQKIARGCKRRRFPACLGFKDKGGALFSAAETGMMAKSRRRNRGRGNVMERIWLKHYPPGVPAEIDPSQYRSAAALIEECFAKFAPAHGYSFMGKEFTYRQIDEDSKALGAWLQA